ncbi:MAG: DUF1566 domain-containing protein, partial [Spirochaetaceae bacterium]|nr:DUF1566 domain-containing protein [Spirochaetaceae bacterium]
MIKRNGLILLIMAVLISCDMVAGGTTGLTDSANWVDVHGAGSQRSDPKTGDPTEYSEGHGPQGDAIRIYNLVRPVRSFSSADLPYSIVDTNQTTRFDNYGAVSDTTVFAGQDADYSSLQASYTDNNDGTVSDNHTGLMWQQNPGEKMTWDEAYEDLESMNLAGYDDWRIPTIKELYSLIQFSGRDIAPEATSANDPFIDTDYFDFSYGNLDAGERIIDSQYMSSTKYVSTTMDGDETVFGVNFADGRIKGYGLKMGNREKDFYVIFVRGNEEYGKNNFIDNGDGTISDLATGLMWMQEDAGPMNWGEALTYSEDLEYAGYDDWRLADAKELQSIVDYSRSPDTSDSAAIDPLFHTTVVENEAGEEDYGFYWSSTTHATSSSSNEGASAAYVAFGRSLGNMANLQMPGMSGPEGGPG